MTDRFKITGASARSKSEFAIGLNIFPLDEEDPYTIFLTYDGAPTENEGVAICLTAAQHKNYTKF